MRGVDPYAFASLAAEQLIKGLGVSQLPISPAQIARQRGIEVVAKPIDDKGASGMLVRFGQEFGIAYTSHLKNTGFENFSVGHELGHYFLPGHVDAVIPDGNGTHVSHAGFASNDRYEIEADRFAASLLMPRHLFVPALRSAGTGFAAIESLSILCDTSLHSTAIRYAQCTPDALAIVISRGGIIDHCFMSQELQSIEGIDWLKKREALPRKSTTFKFNQTPENISRCERIEGTSNLQHWFGGRHNVEICEDVVGLGSYGKTLTVLYDIEVPDPEDEEDERALVDSWTPRF